MYIITYIIIFNYEKNNLIEILSSLIVKFSVMSKPKTHGTRHQVNHINCYHREIISLLQNNDIIIRDCASVLNGRPRCV